MDLITAMLRMVENLESQDGKNPALVLIKKDDRTAVTYTWYEYLANAQAVAGALQKLNLIQPQKENFFAVAALNRPESFFVLLGIIMAGGVPVPLNPPVLKEAGHKELHAILDDCQPIKVLANEELSPHFQGLGHLTFEQVLTWGGSRLLPDGRWQTAKDFNPSLCISKEKKDLLIMPYTSGTTGAPKGVMLSHGSILDRTTAITAEFKIAPVDRIFSYLMLGHIAELIATFFSALRVGYPVYFTEHAYDLVFQRENFRRHFPGILQTIQPTIFLAVPQIWVNLRQKIEKKLPVFLPKRWVKGRIKRQLGLDLVRHFVSAAAQIQPQELKFFAELGIVIRDIYGQTETAGPLLLDGLEIGKNTFVRLDPQDNEILVRGDCLMLGYYHYPLASEAVLEKISFEDGNGEKREVARYRTGDLGKYHWTPSTFDPRIIFAGRRGRSFKLLNGQFISDQQINTLEDEIKALPAVDAVVVCGENKPYAVALVFVSETKSDQLKRAIKEQVLKIGEGPCRIKNCAILSNEKDLLKTSSTEKPKAKEIIRTFADLIQRM